MTAVEALFARSALGREGGALASTPIDRARLRPRQRDG
jgi:hypothetical protein